MEEDGLPVLGPDGLRRSNAIPDGADPITHCSALCMKAFGAREVHGLSSRSIVADISEW